MIKVWRLSVLVILVGGLRAESLGERAEWFRATLAGEGGEFPGDRVLAQEERKGEFAKLWADYKAAAVALGWDRELRSPQRVPKLPSAEEFQKMSPEERPKIPQFEAGVLSCGTETMPYFYLSRGEKPEGGFPLFFQTHGGGSTGEKLEHPHAWPVNTRDWKAQLGVCLFALPEGQYFVPRMANDNQGRWWKKHNHVAFDRVIRLSVLFHEVDANRIYMMGISEGAYGTEALTPFWADRFAGGVAMAGGAGGRERLVNLRNTPFRSDTGENDTMFDRINLAREAQGYLAKLKEMDPEGYDHSLNIQAGRGHGIDYQPGPAWIATKTRNPRPKVVRWFNFALDGERRRDFSWLSLAEVPERDVLITAIIDEGENRVQVEALVNPEEVKNESPVHNTATPEPVAVRVPYHGNRLTVHVDEGLVDLDREVVVVVNGKEAFRGMVERRVRNMAADLMRHGDPGRVFAGRVEVGL